MDFEQRLSIDKAIQKKNSRSFAACDSCRQRKKKCDGEEPCSRCKSSSSICIYSKKPRKASVRKGKDIIKQEESLSNTVTTKKYIQLYFQYLNLLGIFHKFDIKSLENPKSKSDLLQCNSILAMSTRAFSSNPKAYQTYENRARQLAGELFDDFTFDTAVGLELLGIHFWWDDVERFGHYRDTANSILQKIYKSGKHDKYATSRMILAVNGSTNFLDSKASRDIVEAKELFKSVAITNRDNSGLTFGTDTTRESNPITDEELLLYIELRSIIARFVSLEDDEQFGTPVRYLPAEELAATLSLVYRLKEAFAYNSSVYIKSELIFRIMAAGALYAGGKREEALSEISIAMDKSDSSDFSFNIIGPLFIDLLHLVFKISFAEKDYYLANRVSGLQRKIAVIMPAMNATMERDMNLLKEIVQSDGLTPNDYSLKPVKNQYNSNKSSSTSPSSVPSSLIPQQLFDSATNFQWPSEEFSFIEQILEVPQTPNYQHSPPNYSQPPISYQQQRSPPNFQQTSPPNYQQPSPPNFQQHSPPNYQQTSPPNYQQNSPPSFSQPSISYQQQQRSPPNYQTSPPGFTQPNYVRTSPPQYTSNQPYQSQPFGFHNFTGSNGYNSMR